MNKITIFGCWWGGNLGDTAIVKSIISSINREYDVEKIVIPSKQPDLIKKYVGKIYNVEVIRSINHYMGKKTIQSIRSSDRVIIGGGGLFFSHKIHNPFYNHIVNLWPISHICNILDTPAHILSVGATHIDTKLSKRLVERIIKNSISVSARDKKSQSNLETISGSSVPLIPDPAFTIRPSATRRIQRASKQLPNDFLLLSLHHEIGKYSKFSSEEIGDNIIQDTYQYASEHSKPVLLYNNYINNNWFIDRATAIQRNYEDLDVFTLSIDHVQPEELIWLLKRGHFAVASQMHMNIFCIMAGLASIPIKYDNKVKSMMELFHKGEQVLDPSAVIHSDNWLTVELDKIEPVEMRLVEKKQREFQDHIKSFDK